MTTNALLNAADRLPRPNSGSAAEPAGDAIADAVPVLATTVIRPAVGWQFINVRELWQSRELLFFLIWRDIKVRYKQTLLGAAWAILQPVMMMVVFTIFFGRMAKVPTGGVPYPLFVFAGLLPWTFFATAITNAGNSVVGSERLITKIYFPRLVVPFAAVGAALADFAIALGVLVALMMWYGVRPGPDILLMPVMILSLAVGALGVGSLLAALNVAYRDFRYVIPFLIQLWMFATPTVYMQPSETATHSQAVKYVLALNPITGLIGAFRAAVIGGAVPWSQTIMAIGVVACAFVLGCLYFRRVEDRFADMI
jgi:lipopolysaccharide transport system permease protein